MAILFPKKQVDSFYDISFEQLYNEGFRAVITDIDNTLVPHGAPADQRAISMLAHLKELGYSCVLLSNNSEERVRPFAEAVDLPFIHKAAKPKPGNYKKAMELMGSTPENTLFVGDQIYTDVLGANLAKVYSIIVRPIHPQEVFSVKLKRILEKPVLWSFTLIQKCKRKGDTV